MITPRALQGQHHIRYPRKTSVAKTRQNQTFCNLAQFPPAEILPFPPQDVGKKLKSRQVQKKN